MPSSLLAQVGAVCVHNEQMDGVNGEKKEGREEEEGEKGRGGRKRNEGKVNWGYEICTVFLQRFLRSVSETTGRVSLLQ